MMIFEMRTYTICPGKTGDYLEHFQSVGLPIISKYAELVGYWIAETGELNQLIHIWSYPSLDERSSKRADLYRDTEWQDNFLPKALGMLVKQESRILQAAAFSPIR